MAARDVERFEVVACSLLDELGYERAIPQPSAESLKHSTRMRELFTAYVHTSGRLSE